jgi:hypothetical protein
MILVFGILGFVVCLLFGIAAWAMGASDLKEMDAGTMDPSGRTETKIGMYLGMASTILALVGFLFFFLALGGTCTLVPSV